MRKKKYASDISREQFEQIRLLLEKAHKCTKPRMVNLYEVWSAVPILERLPMANATGSVSEMTHGVFLLCQMERAGREGNVPAGADVKKSGWRGSYKTGVQRTVDAIDCDAQSVKNTDTVGLKG